MAVKGLGEKPTPAFDSIKHVQKHFNNVMWLRKKILVFMPKHLNLRSVTAVTFLRMCIPFLGLSFLLGHIRSEFSAVSQKQDHLLK